MIVTPTIGLLTLLALFAVMLVVWYGVLIAALILAIVIAAIFSVVVAVAEWVASGRGIFSQRRRQGRFG